MPEIVVVSISFIADCALCFHCVFTWFLQKTVCAKIKARRGIFAHTFFALFVWFSNRKYVGRATSTNRPQQFTLLDTSHWCANMRMSWRLVAVCHGIEGEPNWNKNEIRNKQYKIDFPNSRSTHSEGVPHPPTNNQPPQNACFRNPPNSSKHIHSEGTD